MEIREAVEVVRHEAILVALAVGAAQQEATFVLIWISFPAAFAVVKHHGAAELVGAVGIDRNLPRALAGTAVVLVGLGDLSTREFAINEVLKRVARECPVAREKAEIFGLKKFLRADGAHVRKNFFKPKISA